MNPLQVHGKLEGKEKKGSKFEESKIEDRGNGAMEQHTKMTMTFNKSILGRHVADQLEAFRVSLCLMFHLNGIFESC